MSEPAKDEAELLDRVASARCECQPGGCYVLDGGMYCHASGEYVASVIAAIRAAGWAVLPLRLMEELTPAEADALRVENARLREALSGLMEGASAEEGWWTLIRAHSSTLDAARAALAPEVKP